MDELFRKADEQGLWFFCTYQQLWFSPAELRAAQADKRFLWGAENWTLRDPDELIEEKRVAIVNATREFDMVVARIHTARHPIVT